jgi:transposase
MCPVKYFTQVCLNQDLRSLRYQLIRYAQKNGIKPAARLFHTTPTTVRKWLKRYEENALDALVDSRTLVRARTSKIPVDQKEKAIRLKKTNMSWGALKIKKYYKLNISDKAIRKIWKDEGLM